MTLPHSKNPLLYPARFQFQSNSPCNGSSTCTDTCIQEIVEYYKEKTYSLNYVRNRAQALTNYDEHPCTGINYVETLNALKLLGVNHYRVGWGMNALQVAAKSNIGPTIVGVYYGSYPRNTSGYCGTSNRAEIGGKIDCGFNGSHAVLAIGSRAHRNAKGKVVHIDILSRDPDHRNSPRPSFDRFPLSQLNAAMLALPAHTGFSQTYCIYPTIRK